MPKFMQSLGMDNYHRLLSEAKSRDVTVQALIRTVIVPEWLRTIPATPTSVQTGISTSTRPAIVQPTSLLSRTGIVTEQTRRPFLSNTLGRGRP